ncbi:DUF4238 domain-containing protein [Mucilaginibacter sp. PAMB04168]|uniref:DUF4238 domain-containing protein n=1 Tax=Mucilaginibacter sp. PAMB04168 TaxID=3138567 RepID=UPI0031F6286C
MAKKSRRHHYISEFYTKHFSENENLIQVYDKIDAIFYPTNPVNLFVKKDRNTFENLDGIKDDVIERIYSNLDAEYGSILKKITENGEVSDIHYKKLLFFAYLTKWRVPQYDQSFNVVKENYSAGQLGLGLKSFEGIPFNFEIEELFGLDMQHELKRILLAFQLFRSKEDYKRILTHSFIIPTPAHTSFIGDCPFIETTFDDGRQFGDFIFPITGELTLVYFSRIDRDEIISFLTNGDVMKINRFLTDFSSARDVSLLDLAERHIACGSKERLKFIVETYNGFKNKGGAKGFHMTWFNILYNFKEYL